MAQDIKDNKDLEERAKGPFAHFFISGWTPSGFVGALWLCARILRRLRATAQSAAAG